MLPQPFNRVRQHELLARHAAHEPAATDLAAHLQSSVHREQLPPERSERLSRKEIAKHHAIPLEQLPSPALRPFVAADLNGERRELRPSATVRIRRFSAGTPLPPR